MECSKDCYNFHANFIDKQIGQRGDAQFPCPWEATRTTKVRKMAQAVGRFHNSAINPFRRERIIVGDI
jgi:hypothetical protein